MKVLALTHAHLEANGLSPVSCERADSVVAAWIANLGWKVTVIHTLDTAWKGLWPEGDGIGADVLKIKAPEKLMFRVQPAFSKQVSHLLAQRKYLSVGKLFIKKIIANVRFKIVPDSWIAVPLAVGKKWGQIIYQKIKGRPFDFIFLTIGYGDEYLLQTAHILAEKLNIPIVLDYRDLWSDHHEKKRFTQIQRTIIRKYEKVLLKHVSIISAPHQYMLDLLQWTGKDFYNLTHSAYIHPSWQDSEGNANIFTILYAGKLYKEQEGFQMFLDFVQKLSSIATVPFKVAFYTDEVAVIQHIAKERGIEAYITAHSWISPSALWQKMRSAHILLMYNAGAPKNYPVFSTKAYQYAYTGRLILSLEKYPNPAFEAFLHKYKAGYYALNAEDAVKYVIKNMDNNAFLSNLPPLRKVPERIDEGTKYGRHIQSVLNNK